MSKEDRIGALWRPSSQNPNAPMAKGKISFMGRELKVTLWANKWKKDGEKTPDFYLELDNYDPQAPRPERADSRAAASREKRGDGFTDDVPF